MRYQSVKTYILAGTVFFIFYPTSGAHLINPSSFFAATVVNEKEEQIAHLQDDLSKLKTSLDEKSSAIQTELKRLGDLAEEIKVQLKGADESQKEFLNKKMSLINEMSQELFNMQLQIKEIPNLVEQRVKLLTEVFKEPPAKKLLLPVRSFYSYELFRQEIKDLFDQEDKIKALVIQKKDEGIEFENRKKKLNAVIKSYQDKKKEQEEFASKTSQQEQEVLGLKERGQLLDLEANKLAYERDLDELLVQSITKKIELLTTNIEVEQEKLSVFKENLARAKEGLRIDEAEVRDAHDNLEKLKQNTLATKESLYEELKRTTAKRDQLKRDLENLEKENKVTGVQREKYFIGSLPSASMESSQALCLLGEKNEEVQLLERKIELLRAQIEGEDLKFKREYIKTKSLSLWFDIIHKKLGESIELQESIKIFKDLEKEMSAALNMIEDQSKAATNSLNVENKNLSNLRSLIQNTEHEQTGKRCLDSLNKSQTILTQHLEVIAKLLEVYADSLLIVKGSLKEINIITVEAETRRFWQRSPYAISWRGVKNIIPDLQQFFKSIILIGQNFFFVMTWGAIAQKFISLLQSPGHIIFLFLLFSLMIALYIFLRFNLRRFGNYLLEFSAQGMRGFLLKLCGFLCVFIQDSLTWLYLWVIINFSIYTGLIADNFLRVNFYLISIPFLMYYVMKFTRSFSLYNREHEFSLIAELFERRFTFFVMLLSSITVFVFFFRAAFNVTVIYKSELPNILLAAYDLILKFIILLSIGKEDILSLLSKPGVLRAWVSWFIGRYYYLVLGIAIILMILSDSYIGGYGNLISYILWGIACSIILLRILYSINWYINKYATFIFFRSEDEVKHERFSYGTTWYGVFVIAVYCALVILAIVIGTKIWGIPLSWESIWQSLDYHLYYTGTEGGETIWFTPRKFLLLIGVILSSFVTALAFNKYIMQRIFDIFLVELGVQNMLKTIIQYLIIAMGIYLGFQLVNLGNLLIAIVVLIGSIGWILKESIGDFISYFIILVQRPIEIGDFIEVSDEIKGVVRKITPRSVVLRRKDSYTIFVPNSFFLTQSVKNWNYTRNFAAFDDIYFTVTYDANPLSVKQIIQRVMDENTDILKSPRPVIRLYELGEHGLVFLVRGFISNKNVLNQWDISSDLRFAIINALKQNNIKIAIPRRALYQNQEGK